MLAYVSYFLNYIKIERQLSPHTLRSYKRHLLTIVQQLQQRGITAWLQLEINLVRQLMVQNKSSGLNAANLRQRFSALRTFYSYLRQQGFVDKKNICDFPIPGSAKQLPNSLTIDQVTKLLAIKTYDILSVRDSAIMELFYSTGIRLAEATKLNMDDVDLEQCELQVLGKGQKMRQLPIGKVAVSSLKRWLAVRAPSASNESAFFLSRYGRRISARGIQKRLARWGICQQITARVHPHKLRHTFATHLLSSSGDLRAVQELLGHASLSSTQIYTHLNFNHLSKIYDAAHPRARRQDK